MLINISNHPSCRWSAEQLRTASCYVRIIDIAFPQIDPGATSLQVKSTANEYSQIILDKLSESMDDDNAIHIAGELLFCYELISILKSHNCKVLTSTSSRVVEQVDVNTSIKKFIFVQFREF